jgi:hypothetical protein
MRIFRLSIRFPTASQTSIKSIDLNAATYQNAAGLTGRLQKYVNEVSEFVGGQMEKDVVEFLISKLAR